MRVIDLLDCVHFDFDLEDMHILETDLMGEDDLIGMWDISDGNYSNVPNDARLYNVASWKVIGMYDKDYHTFTYDLLIWV